VESGAEPETDTDTGSGSGIEVIANCVSKAWPIVVC
jgi:hypothetical protein